MFRAPAPACAQVGPAWSLCPSQIPTSLFGTCPRRGAELLGADRQAQGQQSMAGGAGGGAGAWLGAPRLRMGLL